MASVLVAVSALFDTTVCEQGFSAGLLLVPMPGVKLYD